MSFESRSIRSSSVANTRATPRRNTRRNTLITSMSTTSVRIPTTVVLRALLARPAPRNVPVRVATAEKSELAITVDIIVRFCVIAIAETFTSFSLVSTSSTSRPPMSTVTSAAHTSENISTLGMSE